MKYFILVITILVSTNLWAKKKLKTKSTGEGKTETEACYFANGLIRRKMDKMCKDDHGVIYKTMTLSKCDFKKVGELHYKGTYKSEFFCKGED